MVGVISGNMRCGSPSSIVEPLLVRTKTIPLDLFVSDHQAIGDILLLGGGDNPNEFLSLWSFDMKKKLSANDLLCQKYKKTIDRNRFFRHRAASRVFVYAAVSGNVNQLIKVIPWTLVGLFIDFRNFIWTVRTTLSFFYQIKINKNILKRVNNNC